MKNAEGRKLGSKMENNGRIRRKDNSGRGKRGSDERSGREKHESMKGEGKEGRDEKIIERQKGRKIMKRKA